MWWERKTESEGRQEDEMKYLCGRQEREGERETRGAILKKRVSDHDLLSCALTSLVTVEGGCSSPATSATSQSRGASMEYFQAHLQADSVIVAHSLLLICPHFLFSSSPSSAPPLTLPVSSLHRI